jgi:uncharacterized protein (TIGR02453 family)
MVLEPTLRFLEQLRNNNTKEWFEEYRPEYEVARGAFEQFIADVIARFDAVDDVAHLNPKDTIHRIHRDVRFSKDKSPYHTQMSALIGPEGRKSTSRAYYIRIAPGDQSLIGSGARELSSSELQFIRQEIIADAQPLRAILAAESFQRCFGALAGAQLKSAPNGYPKDHPDIDLLRHKEFLAMHLVPDVVVTSDDFADHVVAVCLVAKPLTMYFDQLLGPHARRPNAPLR